jgi:hypothetical protein
MGRRRSRESNRRETATVRRTHSERQRGAGIARGHRHRGSDRAAAPVFYAHDPWHEPEETDVIRLLQEPPGEGFIHPVLLDDVRDRVEQLPARFRQPLNTIQLSRMTRKRALFPCYGLQWGPNVYLYPIEDSLIETFIRPPRPQQLIEAKMFGGVWSQDGDVWRLRWTESTIRDFYLNNVLIHEIGHVNDTRNTNQADRERFADWFAIEHGYRASRAK